MTCDQVRHAVLERLDGGAVDAIDREIDHHLTGCPACAAFAAVQTSLDVQLGALLSPPAPSPAFLAELGGRLAPQRTRQWLDAMPDILHLASCGVATLVCAILLPFQPSTTAATGIVGTVPTYLLLTAVRSSLEERER